MRAADSRGGSCKIVNISDAVAMKREQVDKWLDDKVAEQYGDNDMSTVKNPTLRLMVLYDMLDGEDKSEFYSYVRITAVKMIGERIMREQFWAFMTAIPSQWKDMEEYGRELVCRSGIIKKALLESEKGMNGNALSGEMACEK